MSNADKSVATKVMARLAGVTIVFVYIFNLELSGFGGLAVAHFILFLGLGLINKLNTRSFLAYCRKGAITVLFFVPPFFWAGTHSFFLGSDAIDLPLLTLKTYIWSWLVVLIVFFNFYKNDSFDAFFSEILKIFVMAIFLQSIFVWLTFIFSDIADRINAVLSVKGNLTGLESFRSKGLANSGGANMSMLFSFGVVAAIYLNLIYKLRLYIYIAIFMTLSAALVGRSGFIAGFAFIFLYGFLLGSKRTKFLLFLLPTMTIFFLASLVTFFEIDIDNPWVKWFFLESGDSLSELESMVGNKSDLISLIFGAGFFESAFGGHTRSDSGVIRATFVFGIPMACYFYFSVFYSYWSGFKTVAYRHRPLKYQLILMFLIFLLMIFLFEIKESMFYQNMTGRALFFLSNILILFHYSDQHQTCLRPERE